MGGPIFYPFSDFYLFGDKNSIDSSYFIIEREFFVGILYKKEGLRLGLLGA